MVLHKGPCILTLTIDQVLLILTLHDNSGQVDSAGVHVNEGGHIGFCPEEAACTNTTTPTPTLSTASVTQPGVSTELPNTISGIIYSTILYFEAKGRVLQRSICTGCLYKLSQIDLV